MTKKFLLHSQILQTVNWILKGAKKKMKSRWEIGKQRIANQKMQQTIAADFNVI
jgi:hypothetical protein